MFVINWFDAMIKLALIGNISRSQFYLKKKSEETWDKIEQFPFCLNSRELTFRRLDATAKRQKEKFILIRLRSWYVAISQSYHSITWILYSAVYGGPSSSSLGSKGQLISKCLFGVFKFFQKTNENKSIIVLIKSNFSFIFWKNRG